MAQSASDNKDIVQQDPARQPDVSGGADAIAGHTGELSASVGGHAAHDHGHGSAFQKIWRPFFILLGITVVEFIIALVLVPGGILSKGTANILYLALTVAKAFYIVAYFMHLKFERLNLIYSIVVPVLFILVLIAALLFEGGQSIY